MLSGFFSRKSAAPAAPTIPGLSASEQALAAKLIDLGQAHLFESWATNAPADEDKARFFAQLEQLDGSYPGGLGAYVGSARQLLADSKAGVNPLDGWTPAVPVGETVAFGRLLRRPRPHFEPAPDAPFLVHSQ